MFNDRNRARLRRFGRRFMHRNVQCPCAAGDCLSLAQVPEGQSAVISCNKNLNTIERGFYLGMKISMFRNDTGEPNLIVAVGDARYVLDRRIAQEIRVRIV